MPRLRDLDAAMRRHELSKRRLLDALPPATRRSAANLLHYMTLRSQDVRELQVELAGLGLSSLGRSEGHVRSNVRAVLRALEALAEHVRPLAQRAEPAEEPEPVSFWEGADLLRRNAELLLGPVPAQRDVRVMVTMSTDAATNPALVRDLLLAGMDVMRINCAHDTLDQWAAMIENLKRAATATGRSCRVMMDIEGPKIRTGPMEPGPRVVSWNPRRDITGRVVRPSLVWLTPRGSTTPPAEAIPDATLALDPDFVRALTAGTEIAFRDHRGLSRRLTVRAVEPGGVLAEADRSAFVAPEVDFFAVVANKELRCVVGDVPPVALPILLNTGDELILTASQTPGRPAAHDSSGRIISPARIPLSLTQAFQDVHPGHRVMLDDGKAAGVVEKVSPSEISVRLTRCRPGGFRLWSDKGVNLPDTDLRIPSLSEDDLRHLAFIAKNADLLGFSFVRTRKDVEEVLTKLRDLGGERVGIILKIETASAFQNLPDLLLAGMAAPASGVMIARGDLAVEIGYERLAEVQEEILWLCEAAHVPVVWATQVLETLAKKGMPSRSEITDAAMGERAECVMLNKGEYVVQAVGVLDDILRRMGSHQTKKRSMLRPLGIARKFCEG
jgi:pyruvate kinase